MHIIYIHILAVDIVLLVISLLRSGSKKNYINIYKCMVHCTLVVCTDGRRLNLKLDVVEHYKMCAYPI